MGHHAPYIYSNQPLNSDFNPRQYSEKASSSSSCCRSFQGSNARGQQPQAPLLNLNKHPDTWMIVADGLHTEEVLPPNIIRKIIATRWLQLFFRVIQCFAAIGLFVCVICIKGTQGNTSWVLRVPAPWDAIVSAYAIYHLLRPVGSRTPASSGSFQWFSLCMDGALVPFYIYATIYTQENFAEPVTTVGRWTTYFHSDSSTNIVLLTAWVTASTLGVTHFCSGFLSLFLGLWFRKIDMLSPDSNPLVPAAHEQHAIKQQNKHKHKSSEMSVSSVSLLRDEKHKSLGGSTVASTSQSSLKDDDSRLVPFAQTRVNGNTTFSPHTLDSVRSQSSLHNQDRSTRSDARCSYYQPRQADAEQQQPTLPSQPVWANYTRTLAPTPDAHYAEAKPMALSPRQQNLVKDNWYAMDKSGFYSASDSSQTQDGPPSKHYHDAGDQPLGSNRPDLASTADYAIEDQENLDQVGRALTMGSSLYSDGSDKVPKSKYYGALSTDNARDASLAARDGTRAASGTDFRLPSSSHRRLVSGKILEEGRSWWMRRRDVSGAA